MPPQRRRGQVQAEDRRRNRQASVDDDGNDDDVGGGDNDSDVRMDGHDDGRSHSQNIDQVMAKKLVRYSIACEYSRTTIRREGIKDKVLGPGNGKAFRRVFALAQEQLRAVWGMELRELPVREKITLKEKRQAAKSNSQPKTGSGLYVLATGLPKPYRTAGIMAPSKSPSAEAEAAYMAFYSLVVAVIMLNGGELGDHKLQRYLDRLNASPLVGHEKTELVLKRMERQQYVVRSVDNTSLESSITWTVGPRGKDEIGAEGVAGLVREVWGGDEGVDADVERRIQASLGIRERPAAAAAVAGQDDDEEEADGDEET